MVMSTDASPVVVTPGLTANTTQVHHHDFPEIRAQGPTAKAAAQQLANQLTRALDSALTKWRRDTVQQAIDEVRAFVANTQD
jgi:hypothetical protein